MVIALAGKGGVGKTTISALLIRYLIKFYKPLLAIDADPNANLNIALGMSYDKTISDIRDEVRNSTPGSISKSEFFDMRLQEAIAEGSGIDLLVMGKPEGPGCYCAINNILREYLAKTTKHYASVVIDNESGMEHLSRRTSNDIDILLLVSDTTNVGLMSAINAYKTAIGIKLKIKHVFILINKVKSSISEDKLKIIKQEGLQIAGVIPFETEIEKNSEDALPVLKLDKDIGMYLSKDFKELLEGKWHGTID